VYDLAYVLAAQGAPHCACGGMLRPDIVFYGEPLNNDVMDSAIRAIMECDLLIVGGTSLSVYPAAGLLGYRRQAKLALINLTETPFDQRADLVVRQSTAAALGSAVPA
jgi:NAD-dependent deacetylase